MSHDIFEAVRQNGAPGASPAVSLQQFRLVGMGGESADSVNLRSDWNLVAQQPHLFSTVDDVSRQGAFSGIPHEDEIVVPRYGP